MSMRAAVFVVLASVAFVGCNIAGATVKGNGKVRTEQRTVPAFEGLSVAGALEIEVTVGGTQSVELTGDDNVLPIIRTRVVKGTLVIDNEENYSTKTRLKVRITTPKLGSLATAGACDGTVTGIAGQRFTLDASGASELELAGATESLAIEVSGSGNIRARKLTAATVSAGVSGAGEIEVTATRALSASISGAGTIDYWGKPATVNRSISGAGEIEGH